MRHGNARELDDPALDGVKKRKIRNRPREQRSLRIAAPAQKKRSRRKIDNRRFPEFALNRLKPGNPKPRHFVASIGFLLFVGGKRFFFVFALLRIFFPVAVVCLVVDDENVLHAEQFRHHAAKHLPLGLERLQSVPAGRAPFEQTLRHRRSCNAFPQFERVVIGDDDDCLLHFVEHVRGNELARSVVGIRIVRLKHAEAVANRQSGSADKEASRKHFARGRADGVERLPRDDHRHNGRLSRAGGEFQRDTEKLRICLLVRVANTSKNLLTFVALGRDFLKPYQRFRRFNLTEERALCRKLMSSPMLEKPRRYGRDAPRRFRKLPPRINGGADFVNLRSKVVILLLGRNVFAFVQNEFRLLRRRIRRSLRVFARCRNRRDKFRPTARVFDDLRRLPVLQFPMTGRALIRGIENRLFKKIRISGGFRIFLLGCVVHLNGSFCGFAGTPKNLEISEKIRNRENSAPRERVI